MLSSVVFFQRYIYIYILFWLFSIFGWLLEVIYCSLYDKKLVNRGFLIGPYCPIYGSGALIMLGITKCSDNLFVCFILSMVFCSVLEYITSFIMEKLFEIRWWDYSNDAFNINGRICLRNAIAFGALGVIFIKFLKPLYQNIIGNLSYESLYIIAFVLFIVTTIDLLISFNAMSKVKGVISKEIDNFKNKDATEEVKKLVNKELLGINFLQKRLIETYHLLDKEKDYIISTIKKVNEKTKSGYGFFLLFIITGIVIGLILSFVFNLGSYKIVIPFSLSISILIASIILKVGDK